MINICQKQKLIFFSNINLKFVLLKLKLPNSNSRVELGVRRKKIRISEYKKKNEELKEDRS